MEKINGICIDGKFYEAVPPFNGECCVGCELANKNGCEVLCVAFDDDVIFRYSPSLTERLNNPKTK